MFDEPRWEELCDQLVSKRPAAGRGAGGIDVNQSTEHCRQRGIEVLAFGLLQFRQERFGAPADGPAQPAEVVVSRPRSTGERARSIGTVPPDRTPPAEGPRISAGVLQNFIGQAVLDLQPGPLGGPADHLSQAQRIGGREQIGSHRGLEQRPEGGLGHGLGEKVRPQRGHDPQPCDLAGRMRQQLEEGARGTGRRCVNSSSNLIHEQPAPRRRAARPGVWWRTR